MAIPDEFMQAKQVLSARLLRVALNEGVMARGRTFVVAGALVNAGRNVHAVGVGRKVVHGRVTDQLAVRLFVVQKIAPSLLPPRDRLPESIDGVPTDVIESAPAFLFTRRPRRAAIAGGVAPAAPFSAHDATAPQCSQDRQTQQRPVVAGISTAHYDVTAGTIGYFCRSTRQGDDPTRVYVLSNNHVFANVNKGVPGDELYQPGPADGGTAADHFAKLERFVRLNLASSPANRVDGAIGALMEGVEYRAEVCSIGAITGTAQATDQMAVRKHGRTTGYTEGVVTDETYDAVVGMDPSDPSVVAAFTNQMRIAPTSAYPAIGLGGDSGSLVVEQAGQNAVGLYFAGPPAGDYGIANHIEDVLSQLEIQLL
jgi:hypothetical protein